jgi:hypothetical protein
MMLLVPEPAAGRLWVKLLSVPHAWLYAGILLFAAMGNAGANPSDGRAADARRVRHRRLPDVAAGTIRSRR